MSKYGVLFDEAVPTGSAFADMGALNPIGEPGRLP